MPICPKCDKEWPDGMTACPDDGSSFSLGDDDTFAAGLVGGVNPLSMQMPAPAVAGASAALAVAQPLPDEPPPLTDLLPGFVVGEYCVDKKIGEGGMGAVYSATHPMIGKRAAIKVISAALGTDASAVGRFVQEARSVNQIGHPNIVDVFAFGELPDGRNYFVMEYLQGESLADRIGKSAMPLGEAIEILDQVADALEAAHEKQIVHRDLKPDNVYLAAVRGGRTMVKLLDFGIAKLSAPDSPGSGGGMAKTRTGMMMGTPGYLSPEQARGKNVDHRTDIYALGCMTFEIVCGRLPFVADNAMDIVLAHMTEMPVRASAVWPEIPPPLDEIIARMLEKDANARPSLTEVRAVFSELVTSGLVTLTAGRGIAFGSGISRMHQTPPSGLPRPSTGMGSAGTMQGLAVGTQPATQAPSTVPPTVALEAPKKRTGLIFGALGAVVLLGGAGAFIAMQGGKDAEKPAPVAAAPEPVPTPAPAPEPPKPAAEPAPIVEAPKPEPGTIKIAINVAKAQVEVDGKPVEVTGKSAKVTVDDAGPHLVTVSAPGRETFETTIDTKPGETSRVIAKLDRARSGSRRTNSARSKSGSATAATTTATGSAATGATTTTKPPAREPGKKAPDVKKDATIDPFAQ